MPVMKRIKLLIKSWSATRANPVEELQGAHHAMRRILDDALAGKTRHRQDLALFDDLFFDAIDLAKKPAKPEVEAAT